MNTVRTTISLDKNLHRQLLTQAFSMGKSLSQVIDMRLRNINSGKSVRKAKSNSDLALFARLAKKADKTDWTKLVREERDRNR
ncbi:hypothetical protein HYW54_03685 [Candidatus Gottesmanbacteria bacterium]|nr:hypothetical protein [Candidatus Gottesmanbacteria bacterium]